MCNILVQILLMVLQRAEWRLKRAGWRWVELGGGGWSWVGLGGGGWSWVEVGARFNNTLTLIVEKKIISVVCIFIVLWPALAFDSD